MTRVVINSGSCGYAVVVTVEQTADRRVRVTLETDCEMVQKMAQEIGELDKLAVFTRMLDNPVYRSASRHLKHAACPVPAGILKAIEVETGLNVARDATIIFEEAPKKA